MSELSDHQNNPEEIQSDATAESRTEIPEIVEAISPAFACGPIGNFSGIQWLLRQLGNRWSFPILGALHHGPMRFAKLKRALDPVSQRMLTLSLRKLERDDLVYREEVAGQPPQVTYGLTPLGIALVQRLSDFESWLARNRQMLGGERRN